MGRALVAGAGGFIGGHMVARLVADGHDVVAVDVKPVDRWYQSHPEADSYCTDLSGATTCEEAVKGCDVVVNLAADMGGMGFISNNKAACMLSVLPSTLLLVAARDAGVERFFFASSACVYADYRQEFAHDVALRESDAYPAMPEDGYGWEKLFTERMCRHFAEDYSLVTRVARYHNVYGIHGTWDGGREKAPAAICRKVAEAVASGGHDIEVWGDGEQTRSFMYVDDCVEGSMRLLHSDVAEPLNVGSSELVTINELVSLVEDIAGVTLQRRYDRSAPQGVRGRNSDNTLIRERLGWEPSISLREGMEKTYAWVAEQVERKRA